MEPIKCVLIGDGAVGKSYIVKTYTTNKYPLEYIPTIFDSNTVTVDINNEKHSLNLVVTAGQEQYEKLRQLIYPQTDVFLVCFSISSPQSFENIKYVWIPEISQKYRNIPFLLVGTKLDLRNDINEIDELAKYNKKPVTIENGVKLAKELKAVKYIECSSKTREGLKAVIDEAVLAALKNRKSSTKKSSCTIN